MGRMESIARSIVQTIVHGAKDRSRSKPLAWILTIIATIFSFYELPLHKHRPSLFSELREKHWKLTEDDYTASFTSDEVSKPEDMLNKLGDMGFSGSTFFSTSDQKYLIKSVSRSHEHTFFRDDLLDIYAKHVATHPDSFIVRICDFLASSGWAIGHRLGLAPSHHIVMENIMYGKDEAKKAGKPDWEEWDLKPTSYFYPERDIADGRLTSEATKDQLADEFNDKIILTKEQAEEFWRNLEEDTRMLAATNAVDYSLFLVRIQTEAPAEEVSDPSSTSSPPAEANDLVPREPPATPPKPPSWRSGIPSADGKYLYRAALLDFFWAKHKMQPRLMTLLINAYNKLISHHGPMSITTSPEEYRERFLKLAHEIVEVRET
ncbi:Twinfilin-1 [Gnomoniopsis smithogilvyi]|uniref:Twinfilin-1 n=1 Tax=Gnomoniopsis smithogilvyi TaxID=1191159 RepID=A0A9W8Z1M1_9PEZI|nr:Twinfilin-1 [Gnomoniopsis smithogilvyi]